MPAAHRLTLTAAEFSLLLAESGVRLPPGSVVAESVLATTPVSAADADDWLTEAATAQVGLRRRGLLDGDGTPVAPVEATLAVLCGPRLCVRTELTLDGRHHRALHTLSGGLAAALLTPAGAEVELALFPAWELSAELTRAVPDLKREPDAALTGTLPLAALANVAAPTSDATGFDPASGARRLAAEPGRAPGAGREAGADDLTDGAAVLLRQVTRRMCGTLRSVVTAGDGVVLGQVLWLATDAGWLGVRPGAQPAGRGFVALEQVNPADLGSWLAPILETGLDTER